MMIDGYVSEQIKNNLLDKTYKADSSTRLIAPYLEVNESGICKVFGETSQVIIPKEIFIEAFNRWCR